MEIVCVNDKEFIKIKGWVNNAPYRIKYLNHILSSHSQELWDNLHGVYNSIENDRCLYDIFSPKKGVDTNSLFLLL